MQTPHFNFSSARAFLLACIIAGVPMGCATAPKINAFKPVSADSTKTNRALMVGRWVGESEIKEGGTRRWLVQRFLNGSYKIIFHTRSPGAKEFTEQVEVGEWGISGPVYFTILKGWMQNGKLVPAFADDSTNYDAYAIIALDQSKLKYRSLEYGDEFTVEKVNELYKFE